MTQTAGGGSSNSTTTTAATEAISSCNFARGRAGGVAKVMALTAWA